MYRFCFIQNSKTPAHKAASCKATNQRRIQFHFEKRRPLPAAPLLRTAAVVMSSAAATGDAAFPHPTLRGLMHPMNAIQAKSPLSQLNIPVAHNPLLSEFPFCARIKPSSQPSLPCLLAFGRYQQYYAATLRTRQFSGVTRDTPMALTNTLHTSCVPACNDG